MISHLNFLLHMFIFSWNIGRIGKNYTQNVGDIVYRLHFTNETVNTNKISCFEDEVVKNHLTTIFQCSNPNP